MLFVPSVLINPPLHAGVALLILQAHINAPCGRLATIFFCTSNLCQVPEELREDERGLAAQPFAPRSFPHEGATDSD